MEGKRRGGGKGWRGGRGEGKRMEGGRKQFCQLSSKLCDGGNSDPLALRRPIFHLPHVQKICPSGGKGRKILPNLNGKMFSMQEKEHKSGLICLTPPSVPAALFQSL